MKKLRLNIDKLTVESFDVGMDLKKGGTVKANSCSEPSNCGTCATYCGTCYENTCVTCVSTCQNVDCTPNHICWE